MRGALRGTLFAYAAGSCEMRLKSGPNLPRRRFRYGADAVSLPIRGGEEATVTRVELGHSSSSPHMRSSMGGPASVRRV
jgi:hypothetical protein